MTLFLKLEEMVQSVIHQMDLFKKNYTMMIIVIKTNKVSRIPPLILVSNCRMLHMGNQSDQLNIAQVMYSVWWLQLGLIDLIYVSVSLHIYIFIHSITCNMQETKMMWM